MIFFQIHDSPRLLMTYSFNDVLIGYLRYGKTGRNKKRAICFATWLQNELNSDVARFTTHENKPCILISCNYAQHRYSTWFAAMLRNKLHVFCCPFYCSLSLVLYRFFGVQTSVFIQNYVDFGPLFLGIIIHFVQEWSFL